MSPEDVLHALDSLRTAVGSGVRELPESGARSLGQLTVARDDGGLVSLVTLDPAEPLPLAELEAAYGEASALPRRPSGGRRTVQFKATLPAEGETAATVLGELDGTGAVARIIVRRDEL